MKSTFFLLVFALFAGLASPATAQKADAKMKAPGTVLEVAAANGSFTTLLAAIETAGLTEELMGEGPFTIFAPTDEAFGALEEGAVEELLSPSNRENLKTLLGYHVIKGTAFKASDLQSRANQLSYELDTMSGGMAIASAEQGVLIGGSSVAVPNIKASNGIIHIMSSVIIPPALIDLLKNN